MSSWMMIWNSHLILTVVIDMDLTWHWHNLTNWLDKLSLSSWHLKFDMVTIAIDVTCFSIWPPSYYYCFDLTVLDSLPSKDRLVLGHPQPGSGWSEARRPHRRDGLEADPPVRERGVHGRWQCWMGLPILVPRQHPLDPLGDQLVDRREVQGAEALGADGPGVLQGGPTGGAP